MITTTINIRWRPPDDSGRSLLAKAEDWLKVTLKDENGNDIDLDEYLDYKYYDKDGNEVTPDEFVDKRADKYQHVTNDVCDYHKNLLKNYCRQSFIFSFVYHVHKTTGCNGKFDWLLFVCLAALALDVIMFILTMVK